MTRQHASHEHVSYRHTPTGRSTRRDPAGDVPTVPLPVGAAAPTRRTARWGWWLAGAGVAAGLLAALAVALPGPDQGLPAEGRVALVVFAAAVLAWTLSRLDDTFVGLAAVLVLVAAGVLAPDTLFSALGGDIVWLLIAAFVLAAGLTATGLPVRLAVLLCARARSVRQLAHLVTAALVLTALAVPSTSGRAAVALPVFLALAEALRDRTAVVRALALLFPTVILLSAIATLIGAGAHMITVRLLTDMTGAGISYGHWLLLGLPFAVLTAHLATELVLLLMTRRRDRAGTLRLSADRLAAHAGVPVRGPLDAAQWRALAIIAVVVTLWSTEPLHGAPPALVALLGAVLITAPGLGTTRMAPALAGVPWSLLLFMVSTAVLGGALATSGAASWLGTALLGVPAGHGVGFLVLVVGISLTAHLVLQSRSARSSVLVPLVIPLAAGLGLNPAAVAFASTAAAGFCHTLPASAKPVALFGAVTEAPTYRRSDLLRLAVLLGPLVGAMVVGFALVGWPALGLPLR
ncbi:SLC13 family permease [Amycolatopsis arida]|uniref:SLC13 family permease n=1 Tax=Amycolatopsis arida TaxID=587909 RepID=UPI001FBB6AE5|nr:SLC13 family permease [Amycolatopsis arida]